MDINATIKTGLYSVPIIIGGLFFEKNPLFMEWLIVFGCILLIIKLYSEIETANVKRRFVGYGDLK